MVIDFNENQRNYMEHYKHKLLPVLQKHFSGATVYLFGSRAKGKARSGSDIDIAVDAGSKLEFKVFSLARNEIEDLNIPVNIDLVDFHRVPQGMQEEIIKDGIVWMR